MRGSAWLIAAALAGLAAPAAADVETVPTVVSGSAKWGAPNTVTLNAVVQLNDTCWSNPRVDPRRVGISSRAPVTAPVFIVADHATGRMCAMVVRQVAIPTLDWRIHRDPRLRSVQFIGSAHAVTVVIESAPVINHSAAAPSAIRRSISSAP
jgi:hypothetical protein